MVKLYDEGVYLLNGTEIVTDTVEVRAKTGQDITRAQAAEETMAYRILKAHNTSGNMEELEEMANG